MNVQRRLYATEIIIFIFFQLGTMSVHLTMHWRHQMSLRMSLKMSLRMSQRMSLRMSLRMNQWMAIGERRNHNCWSNQC